MASRVNEAITNILAILRAGGTATLLDGADGIVDGPTLGSDERGAAVYIGFDAAPDSDGQAVESWTQAFDGLPMGRRQKAEVFDIVCAVVCWTGDTDVAAGRAEAYAVLSAVEDDLRAAIDLNIGPSVPTIAHVSEAELFQQQTSDSGLQVRITFRINVSTRI